MRTIFIVLGIIFYCFGHSTGQTADFAYILLPHIRTILDQPSGDTAHIYVMQQVPKHCGKDVDCYINNYRIIIDSLMVKNKFLSSAVLSEELIKLARQKGDKYVEAWGFRKLAMSRDGVSRQDKESIELEEAKYQGQKKADNWGGGYLFSWVYGKRIAHAEQEGNFEEALALSRKHFDIEKKIAKNRADHDLRNYYLQIDKDKLASDKENQALQIRYKNGQLISFIMIALIAACLAAVFFFNLRRQKRDKKALATQNALIQQQSEQLKNLDVAKSRFFANVSHELRTPLTLLLGPVKMLLKEHHLTEEQTRLLQTANQNGQQLLQLVNEILDLQKLEMGKMKVNETLTPLSDFFGRYTAQFESLAYRKQINFSFETTVGKDVLANIDQEKCRQIIYNLLSNAFKFTQESGRIKVSLSLHKDRAQLEVADNGSGIHPEDLPHLFDRYFQTTRPDKPSEGGTDIGLALCNEYTQLFGGKIEVESEMGKGSIFRVAFPVTLSESTVAVPVIVESAHVSLPLAKPENGLSEKAVDDALPTILVVEDNPDLQEYLRIVLSEHYQVCLASHGQDALDRCLAQGSLPDLILSDLMMPVMDGYQLLGKLKSSDATRHIPIVMLTARAEAREKLKALRIGVEDCMTKPFDEEELLVRIDNLLKNQAAWKQEAPSMPASETIRPKISQEDQQWLEGFEAYVQKHLSSDTLSVTYLGQEFTMSESTLLRKLKRLTGFSPVQYIQEMRLDEARRMLERRQYNSIAQVASKVGYNDTRSFARSFKQRFGKLPSEMLFE